MSEPTRWKHDALGHMTTEPDGEYVAYEDYLRSSGCSRQTTYCYDKTIQERDAAESTLAAVREQLATMTENRDALLAYTKEADARCKELEGLASKVAEAWITNKGWDCSHSPGHDEADTAICNLSNALTPTEDGHE